MTDDSRSANGYDNYHPRPIDVNAVHLGLGE